MKKILKWFLMLSKRLYKKPSFLVLLLLIPFCVFAFSFAAKQDSGFVHVILAQTNGDDPISSEVIRSLSEETSIIRFTTAKTPQAAIDSVKNGAADEAWIFPADTQSEIENFLSQNNEYVITVVTKEQNVSLRLAREKLTASLYQYCAKAYYLDYIRDNISQLDHISNQKLIAYFEKVNIDENLFVLGNPINTVSSPKDTNYLTSPIRGLLAILAVLCGMSATMYHMQDEQAGTFSYVKQNRKGITALGCVLTANLNISVVLFFSLFLSSLTANLVIELLALFLYSFCCASFCLLLRQSFSSLRSYSAIIPLLTIGMISICPVFFDFRSLSSVQLLFPPTYYVNAIYDSAYFFYMLVYIAICLGLSYGLKTLKETFKIKTAR